MFLTTMMNCQLVTCNHKKTDWFRLRSQYHFQNMWKENRKILAGLKSQVRYRVTLIWLSKWYMCWYLFCVCSIINTGREYMVSTIILRSDSISCDANLLFLLHVTCFPSTSKFLVARYLEGRTSALLTMNYGIPPSAVKIDAIYTYSQKHYLVRMSGGVLTEDI